MVISALIRRIFITSLGVALLGYAFLGRGFAYIGIPPLYVDAFLWGLAFLTLLFNYGWVKLLKLPHTWLLLAFMVWGSIRTIPYLPVYGLDALRDGVSWGYGLFALAVGYVVVRENLWIRMAKWYNRWFFRFVIWAPIAFAVYTLFHDELPRFPWGPGGGTPVLNPKGGDIAVHLAGVLGFWLSLLPYLRQQRSYFGQWVFWVGWLAGFALVASRVRAALLAVGLVISVLMFHVNIARWAKVSALLLLLISFLAVTGIEVDIDSRTRISFDQLLINVESIFSDVEGFAGEGTKRWRLEWWSTIVQYTVFGEYFWTGKGFGINLANDDGFQVNSDNSLRSPHNGLLTILARAGVPGAVLWLFLQGWFGLSLWLQYWKKKLKGEPQAAGFSLWVFVYWLAAIVNSAFDVYLEGPQGGVWFWSIFGVGLGLILAESRQERARLIPSHSLPTARR